MLVLSNLLTIDYSTLPGSVGDMQQFADRVWKDVVAALQRDTQVPLT